MMNKEGKLYDRLDVIPMGRFIDMACGDVHALGDAPEDVLEETARKLRHEYYAIVNERAAKADVVKGDRMLKLKMKMCCLGHAEWLASMGEREDAAELMDSIGYGCTAETVDARVKSARAELAFYAERLKGDDGNDSRPRDAATMREGYVRERAFLMTYHKMYIDVNTMTAGEYANILAMTDKELRSRIEATKGRKRK